jgi:hypothetical protein
VRTSTSPVDGSAPAAGPGTHDNRLTRVLRTRPLLVSVLVLVLAGLGLGALHVVKHTDMSPVDELQHIDYLFKAPAVVHSGEKVGQEAMREQACRGLVLWATPVPCDPEATYDPEDFQESGSNTAAIYTPLYYTLTRVVALPLDLVPGVGLVTAARLAGGVWLAAGLVVSLLAARRLGAHPYTATPLLLATASVPTVLYPAATITPDALALLGGAALLWSVLWWQDAPSRRWWLPALLSALVVLVKALNIVVVVLVALYVLLRVVTAEVRRRRTAAAGTDVVVVDDRAPRPAQAAIVITAMSVLSLALAFGYILYTGATAVASSDGVDMTERTRADAFPLAPMIEHTGVFLQVFYDAGSWNVLGSVGVVNQRLLGLFVFGATFAAALVARKVSADLRLMAASLLVVGLVGAPLIMAFTYLSQGIVVPIPGRYALTLIPAGVAVAAATLRDRPARITAQVVGVLLFLATLAFLLR